jgi:hypothetical protein
MMNAVRVAPAVIAVVAVTGVARAGGDEAAPEREDVELRYSAPPECPDRAALEAAIAERAPAARFVAGAARVFAVTVTTSAEGFAGELSVAGDDGPAARNLTAARCDDLAGALALIVALAIDPSAASLGPVAVEPALERVAVAAPVATVRDDTTPAPKPEDRGPWIDVEVSGLIAGGITPGALLGGAVEARLEVRRLGHLDLAALVGRDTADNAGGTSRFTFLAGRLSACRRLMAGSVWLDACAHVEAGGLTGSGGQIVNAQGSTRLWLAPGAHAAARWPMTSRVFAEMAAGVSVPLVRHHFYFNPDITIHRTAAAIPWLAVGVGLRFP